MDPEQNQKKSFGPLIGIIVIIALIIIGGLYFWKGMASDNAEPASTTTTTTYSNESDSIQADLDASANSGTSADFSDIESQFNQ